MARSFNFGLAVTKKISAPPGRLNTEPTHCGCDSESASKSPRVFYFNRLVAGKVQAEGWAVKPIFG
jgi:hypothetical protein